VTDFKLEVPEISFIKYHLNISPVERINVIHSTSIDGLERELELAVLRNLSDFPPIVFFRKVIFIKRRISLEKLIKLNLFQRHLSSIRGSRFKRKRVILVKCNPFLLSLNNFTQ
jgi:hypothetical protein